MKILKKLHLDLNQNANHFKKETSLKNVMNVNISPKKMIIFRNISDFRKKKSQI